MSDKAVIARELAKAHREVEPGIERIIRIIGAAEESPGEPVKLLEVNRDTPPSGVVPIAFGPAGGIFYPSIVVEVTPDEFAEIERKQLTLPLGWSLGEEL